jgi:hypothetical protein
MRNAEKKKKSELFECGSGNAEGGKKTKSELFECGRWKKR